MLVNRDLNKIFRARGIRLPPREQQYAGGVVGVCLALSGLFILMAIIIYKFII